MQIEWVRRSQRSRATTDPSVGYQPGCRVWGAAPDRPDWNRANDKSSWYPGTITQRNEDLSYCIAFDDKEVLHTVPFEHIRLRREDESAPMAEALPNSKRPPLPTGCTNTKRPRIGTTVAPDDRGAPIRRHLAQLSARAEALRQASGTLCREVLDAAAASGHWTTDRRFERWLSKVNGLIAKCAIEPTIQRFTDDGALSPEPTTSLADAATGHRERPTTAGEVCAAAIGACSACHGLAVMTRTRLPPNPSETQLGSFDQLMLHNDGLHNDGLHKARSSLVRLADLLATLVRSAAKPVCHTLNLDWSDNPMAPQSLPGLLQVAIRLRDMLSASCGILFDQDYAIALNELVRSDTSGGSAARSQKFLRKLAVSLLHLLSRLRPRAFRADWIPCEGRDVFPDGTTLQDAWLASGDRWKLPFLNCDTLPQLETCLFELILAIKPAQFSRSESGCALMLEAQRWAAQERVSHYGLRSASSEPRPAQLSWETCRSDPAACAWLDEVCAQEELARESSASQHKSLENLWTGQQAHKAEQQFQVATGGLVVVLGGGHNPLALELYQAGLLNESVLAGYWVFETSVPCLSLCARHWPADCGVELEIADAWQGCCRGDVHQLLTPARVRELFGKRFVSLILNTPSCKGHARVVKNRGSASMDEIDVFLAAQEQLEKHNKELGHVSPHTIFECGDMPAHLISSVELATDWNLFNLNAATVSALHRDRTFATTYPVKPVSPNDSRRLLAVTTVLNDYIKAHGKQCLEPEWVEGSQIHGKRKKARTPRAEMPPPQRFERSPAAMLSQAHGGINIVRSPSRDRQEVYHTLGIKATSVLMGYHHKHFTVAVGVANASAESWRVLGNTIQKDVLAHLVAPWIQALHRCTNGRYIRHVATPETSRTAQHCFYSESEARKLPIGAQLAVSDDNRQWALAKVTGHSDHYLKVGWVGNQSWANLSFEVDYKDASWSLSKCKTAKLANDAATRLSNHMFGYVV